MAGIDHVSKLRAARIDSSLSYNTATTTLRQGNDTTTSTGNSTSDDENVQPKGYTFDPCFYHRDCIEPRLCVRSDWEGSCSGSSNCYCLAPEIQFCDKCNECEFYDEKNINETCVIAPSDYAAGLCISAYTVWEAITEETDCDSYPDVTPYPEEGVSDPAFDGQTLGGNGYDNTTSNYQEQSSPPPITPVALPSNIPSSPAASPSLAATDPPMMSPSEVAEPDICVDAQALAHLHPHEKVFAKDRRASVLCDRQGSCATPSHMVVVQVKNARNVAMTMKSYCEKVAEEGCSKRVMHVNSPKFKRGLRVASKTSALQFTAFAATYQTSVEEVTLRTLIHLGL